MTNTPTNDETPSTNRVAVLGLGLIGSVWARHLHAAGSLAASWNRSARPEFPAFVATPREAVEKATEIIIVVSDPAAVEQILISVLPFLTRQHLVIQSSTIGPADSTAFRTLVTGTGAYYLEAPFTGSKPAADAKKTVFYLGGDAAIVARAEATLRIFSTQRLHVGTEEQACTVKLAMNLQIAAQVEALCEALYLARRAGVNDDIFFQCMRGNAAWSGVAALKEPKLRESDYNPQFSARHLLKDLRLLEKSAGEQPLLSLMIARLKRISERGLSDKDFTVLYQLLTSSKSTTP